MGHDNVPTLSPAKWRTTNPPSPSLGPFRKPGIHIRDEPSEKPDLGWKALLKRHRFLLFMLVILTFLCTVYLYFAITFATIDTCSSLQGKSRAQCYQLQKKASQVHGHRRRRALLLHPNEISTYDVIQGDTLDDCGQEFENYSPCRNVSIFHGNCRQRSERPPLCKVPAPSGYQRPAAWQSQTEDTLVVLEHTDASGSPLEKVENSSEQRFNEIRVDVESLGFNGYHMRRVLTIGCPEGKTAPSGFVQKRDASTFAVLGARSSDKCIQNILDEGFPAIMMNLFDGIRFPAHSFDLILSDGCGDLRDLRDIEYLSLVNTLLRPGGSYIWSYAGNDVEAWTQELKKLNWASITRFEDFAIWKKGEDSGVDGLETSRWFYPSLLKKENGSFVGVVSKTHVPTKSFLQGESTLRHNENLADAGAVSTIRTRAMLQRVFAPSTSLWRRRVAHYMELLGKDSFSQVRNVLDMNAELGSFAAALMHYHPVWVMNVIPIFDTQRLEAVFARGLLGILHNWSEAFPTPPRSYDLVHWSWTFSDSEGVGAQEMINVILEVDRILRPEGLVIVREASETASKVKLLAGYVRWRVLYQYIGEAEHTEHVLILRKESVAR